MNRQLAFEQLQAEFSMSTLHKGQARLSVGHDMLDSALGGGLLAKRVHLVRGDMPSSSATAFTLALVSMVVHQAKEKGLFYGVGLRAVDMQASFLVQVYWKWGCAQNNLSLYVNLTLCGVLRHLKKR